MDTRENPKKEKINGWVDFYRNNEEVRNPIKLNQPLFKKGIVAISYRNANPNQFANESMITLGNRTFAQQTRIESCSVISIKASIIKPDSIIKRDEPLDAMLDTEPLTTPFDNEFPFNDQMLSPKEILILEHLLEYSESSYLLTNTNLFFVKKTPENKLEISLIKFKEKNNLETLRIKLSQLKQPKLSSKSFYNNPNITTLLFENCSPTDKPIQIINSMTGHHVNDGPSITKQKNVLDWLTKDNKQITYNTKNYLGNLERRDETFIPVAIHSKEETGFNIYPWTSSLPKTPFTGFKQVVTVGCMFGTFLQGEVGFLSKEGYVIFDSKKRLIKHDLQFTCLREKIIDVECIEGKNPYEEIIFEDFRKLLNFIQVTSCSPKEKVKLTYHLPYADYMLFGIKLFLHSRMSIGALHKFFIEILNEKKVYEKRLAGMIKELDLETLIELNIQSPFSPLLKLIDINSEQKLEESLTALGVDINAINFSSEEDLDSKEEEEQQQMRGFKQEKILVQNCFRFLQKQASPEVKKIWDDLIDSHPFIQIFLAEDNADITNFIEDTIFNDAAIKKLLTNFPVIKTINSSVLKNLCDDTTLTFIDTFDKNSSVMDLINTCPDKKTFINLMTNQLGKYDASVKNLVNKYLKNKNFLINDLKQALDCRTNNPELKELQDLTNQYIAIENLKKLLKYPAINDLINKGISLKTFLETPLENIVKPIINQILALHLPQDSINNINNIIYHYPNPFHQSPIEHSFDIANIFSLAKAAAASIEAPAAPPPCSFLSATEKQIQSSYQLFQKKYRGYAPVINLTYFDTVLTYDAQNEKKSSNLTNTAGLAFYFYYPSPQRLNEELQYLLPKANHNLVKFADSNYKNSQVMFKPKPAAPPAVLPTLQNTGCRI